MIVIGRGFLGSSLWLDELLSAWVLRDGFGQIAERAVNYQGQSPLYYWLLAGWSTLSSGSPSAEVSSEAWLRGFSLLNITLAAIFLYQLAKHLVNREFASIVVIFFVVIDSVIWSLSARPYAFALFLAIFSCWSLLQYLSHRKLSHLVLYTISGAAVIYSHYLFAGIFLVHFGIVYIFGCQTLGGQSSETRSYRQLIVPLGSALLVILAVCWPLLDQILSLAARSSQLTMKAPAGLSQVLDNLMPIYFLIYTLFPLALTLVVWRGALFKLPSERVVLFALLWYLTPLVSLYLLGLLLGSNFLINRYLLWGTPGLALLGAALIYGIRPFGPRVLAVLAAVLFMLVREGGRYWKVEEWREAAVIAAAVAERMEPSERASKLVYLVYPGLVEADDIEFLKNDRNSSYLLAPASHYLKFPADANIALLPSHLEGYDRADYREYIFKRLANAELVIVIAQAKEVGRTGRNTVRYYSELLANSGWQVTTIPGTELVRVVRGRKQE